MFDPLGHHQQPQRAGEVDDRTHDDAVAVVAVDAAGKAAVDLQIVDRQPREQRQAGIAGAEIVDRDRAAERADLRQLRRRARRVAERSEEHTSELQSLMRISYAVFCLKKKRNMKKYRQPDNNQTTN